jgi:hypothetical protein
MLSGLPMGVSFFRFCGIGLRTSTPELVPSDEERLCAKADT